MGKEREIDALASEGIAASEKEFFAEVMGQDDPVQDETGDRSLEEIGKGLEGQHEPDDDGDGESEAAEAGAKSQDGPKAEDADGEKGDEGNGEAQAGDRDAQGRFRPKGESEPGKPETAAERGLRGELTTEREKRRTAETDFANYRSQMDRDMAALRGQVELLTRQQQPKPKSEEQSKPAEAPDVWTDPEGYHRFHQERIRAEVRQEREAELNERAAESFREAGTKYGDEFTKAYAAIDALPQDDPQSKAIVHSIRTALNPGERLVAIYRRQQAAKEIGNDPVAYRDRLASETRESLMKDPEFRKQAIEAWKAEANGGAPSNDGGPRTTTRLPPSLSSARGGAPSRQDIGSGSDAELFEQVMA